MQANRMNIISHGQQLVTDLFPGAHPTKRHAFLFLHGFPYGYPNHDAAGELAKLGFTCLTYFMAGNAPSEGDIDEVTIERSVDDTKAAYEMLRGYVGSTALIGVVGSSFGSYIATLLTKEKPVNSLSLRVPANYPDEYIDKPLNEQLKGPALRDWREQGDITPHTNQALAALSDFRGAVQIIRAAKDESIPQSVVDGFAGVISPEVPLEYEVTDTGHSLSTEPGAGEAYSALLAQWAMRLPG